MEGAAVGFAGFFALLVLLVLRVPIAMAMLAVGLAGSAYLSGWGPVLASLKTQPYATFASYSFSIIPMFLLMGALAARAGLARALFDLAQRGLGRFRGGVAMSAVAGCGLFGAICGSSLATAATMGRIALPELRRQGYSHEMAAGALSAGGTLGILIPPSIVLVLFALLTEQNIATLFLAAFLPGLLAFAGYLAAVWITAWLRGEGAGGGGANGADDSGSGDREGRWPALSALGIFIVVIGGIYSGAFTPTEAAAVGVVLTLALALARRMAWSDFRAALLETATTAAMIYMILLGADLFSAFLARTQAPQMLTEWASGSGLSPMVILIGVLLLYVLLGCLMDSLSMIILTVPLFFPLIVSLDFGLTPTEIAIWFGILTLVVVEVGLITPPIGMNVFIIHRLSGAKDMAATFRGVVPFLISDAVRVALLVAFPAITLVFV
jgi:C4-dicarboxylate transporter DctM subunit